MTNTIPGYQIIKKIGSGGMSTVYLSIQLNVGREVALKVLSPELRNDAVFGDQFFKEANIVGGFSHPNIISIYDVFKHENHFCMAMDYLSSDSCKDRIKKQAISPLDALKILKEVAQGLEHIHQKQFIHCDIKPENILFRMNGQAVITDFGIARPIPDDKTNQVAGTPYYMSPEQAQGYSLDIRTDIYSLGILLFEMLTQEVPYKGKDPVAIAIKHVSSPIPQLPEELHALTPLLTKCMAKKPGARFQNCNEVIQAIDFIESQYLKQQKTELPFKLKVAFALQKIKTPLELLFTQTKNINISMKNGLVLKNIQLAAYNESASGEKTSIDNNHTIINMDEIIDDTIENALTRGNARVIIPAMTMKILMLILAILGISILSVLAYFLFANNVGSPNIIYID